MAGKVFVSCGMHLPEEREAALRVSELLKTIFGLKPYVAISVHSLDDVMTITNELRSSDYYLFIDFKRQSLFTHQEFALAHHLRFGGNIIALRETRRPKGPLSFLKRKATDSPQGFLRYVLSNPAAFESIDDLIKQVRRLVSEKGWTPGYSRNLVVNRTMKRSGVLSYRDHTGTSLHESWRATIENHRPDAAAVGAICILDSILLPSGVRHSSPDRGYLKWVGHGSYERTLLPNSSEEIDVFAVRQGQPGLFLLSTLDSHPRQPIVTDNGEYELTYKVFARDFPMLEFALTVNLKWQPPSAAGGFWPNQTEAGVKE